MISHPRVWEIWHARFNYSQGHGYKYRPVIGVGTRSDGILVMMVTDAGNKMHLEHDYIIKHWAEAGLVKPSIARVDRIAKIPADYLGTAQKIGKLSPDDIKAVAQTMNKIYK